MMTSYFNLLKYAATGIASPDMTYYDKLRASTLMGGAVQTLTGQPPLSFNSNGTPLISWSMKGNGSQSGTPTHDNPVMPNFCGVRTGNLWSDSGFSARDITSTHEHTDTNTYGTTLSTTVGKEVTVTQSAYPTGNVGYQNGFFFIDVDFSKYEIGDKITLSFDYIVNEVHALRSQTSTTLYVGKNSNAIIPTFTSGDWKISGRLTAVITIIADMSPYVEVRLCGNSITVKNIMLNSGSAALPYEPFGWAEKITCAGQTTPVYLGQVSTVRKIRKLVLTGTETGWERRGNAMAIVITDVFRPEGIITGMCSHYKQVANAVGYDSLHLGECYFNSGQTPYMYIYDDSINVETFKTYLAAQYANGTPVTVWYILANEQTGIVNEPLAKIGDFADELSSEDAGVSIPTVKGSNTLTVDTDLQPSEMSITYKG